MWFATDHGVCRYNGYTFEIFNLPDNSILGLYEDRKKRIWAYSFSGRLFFYQNGKFENYRWNEQLVNAVKPGVINALYVDSTDALHITASGPAYIRISANGHLQNLMHVNNKASFSSVQITNTGFFTAITSFPVKFNSGNAGTADVTEFAISLFHRKLNIRVPCKVLPERYKLKIFSTNEMFFLSRDCFIHFSERKTPVIQKTSYTIDDMEEIENSYYFATGDGLKIKDKSGNTLQEYFKGVHITSIEQDYEGGVWLTTLTNGVYYLNHTRIKHLSQNGKINEKKVNVLLKLKNAAFLAGTESDGIWKFRVDSLFEHVFLDIKSITSFYQDNSSSVVFVGGTVGLGSDDFWAQNKIVKANGESFLRLPGSSNIVKKDGIMFDGTSERIFEFKFQHGVISDKKNSKNIFRTAGLFVTGNNELLVGNLFGLWRYRDGRIIPFDSSRQLLKSRITNINEYGQKYLCLGTRGNGLLMMLKDSIHQITVEAGLISNNIRKIFIESNHIWIATNQGISIVTISSESPLSYFIRNISVQDGLLSNEVNDIISSAHEMIVATNSGVSFLDKNIVFQKEGSRLPFYMKEIKLNASIIDPDRLIALSYRNRNVSVAFEALNYSNPGKNNYRYRLLGYDTSWVYTNDLRIQFNPLPYGQYQLQIQAKRQFDDWAQASSISCAVACTPPFWATIWFFALSLLLVTGLSFLIFRHRIALIKKRQKEKEELQQKIAATEQMALRSQMNPHFIFNCLNSIQQYVIESDVKGANTFISGFSKLIRQTLEFSAKEKITLGEEISYLSNYLDLEKMRMENGFHYELTVQTIHNPDELDIPPLLLQPYVENALRHGVRFLKNRKGVIRLSFIEKEGFIECSIEDNGIGREASRQLKTRNPIEYQSRGMSLTAERICLLNKTQLKQIGIRIEDMHNAAGESSGTRVNVLFPVGTER